MNEIQAVVGAQLKAIGFRRSGRIYNRPATLCFTQVISFQVGTYRSSSNFVPDLSNHFTMNFGIYIPEFGPPPAKAQIVQESFCAIRARFKDPDRHADWWWPLAEKEASAACVSELIHDQCVPFLDRFSSVDAIANDWLDYGDPALILSGRWSRLRIVAYCLARRGDLDGARQLIEAALEWDRENATPQYVEERARKMLAQAASWGVSGVRVASSNE